MEPKIIERAGFDLVGLDYVGSNQNYEVAALWVQFNQRAQELIASAVPGTPAYGACLMSEGLPEGCFEYVAGFEVRPDALIPPGMVMRHIPACRYAVFSHVGGLEGVGQTFARIYGEWLPAAGLETAKPELNLEVYTDEFKDFAPDSIFYIYVALK